MPGAMGMPGQQAPMGAAHGGGLFDSMGMGGDLFSKSEFELNRESRGGILWVWSRSSRSHFTGMEDALSLDGDVRTTMFGADYSRGALTLGLSSPLGLTARVALSWGGSAQGGAESLWGNQMAYGMGPHQMYGSERLAVKIVIVIAVGAMVIRVAVGVELDLADVIG